MADNMFYDEEFRNKVRGLDEESLAQLIADYADNTEVKVLTNSKSTTYFIIPVSQSNLERLDSIQAGNFNTLSSTGTASSVSSVSSTFSSGATASSLGCAGK